MKALPFLKVITIVNLVVATGFSVAGIVNPYSILPVNLAADKAISVFALYAGARTIPIAIAAFIALSGERRNAFLLLSLLACLIQLLDGFIGMYQQDLSKTIGPFVIAVIEFIAIYLVLKRNRLAA